MLFRSLFAVSLLAALAGAQSPGPRPGALAEVPLGQLKDRHLTPLGQAALTIRPNDWKHSETQNFVYHYFQSFIAAPVSVEAEFYYRIIARELEKETTGWERKCHIFIFETAEDWTQFQKKGSLDPWTGGIHTNGELFIQRNPQLRWKGSALAHEIAHLVVHRFFGAGVPLWLNEGYAEYAGVRGYATFHRARGYTARPRAQAVDPARYLSIAELTNAASYPGNVAEIATFYDEAERLVRFLSMTDKRGFSVLFEALSRGRSFESALAIGFGARFNDLAGLERDFQLYATKEHGTAMQD